jgi:predicted RNase H-like nuclease (RuvC/YqgF family)
MLKMIKETVFYDSIIKGRRSLPVGTVKEVAGKLYIKIADGSWKIKTSNPSKNKRTATGGSEKKPTNSEKPENRFLGDSVAKLKQGIKKLKEALKRFKNDKDKTSKIESAISQMNSSIREQKKK